MGQIDFFPEQCQVRDYPLTKPLFVEGPAASGKTTAAVSRLERILEEQRRGDILILTPQKSLADPFFNFLSGQDFYKGGCPTILTLSGLARRMVIKFWPLIAEKAGFKKSNGKPHFLSLETAQYILGSIVQPFFEKGYFHSITIEKSRLYSQILDNLNKSALVPFPIENISSRLRRFSELDPSVGFAFDQAQECAMKFRKYCLENCLLDFSLLIDTFNNHVWSNPICKSHFYSTFRALIADNIEEDFPVSHDLLQEWVAEMESATFVYDLEGGYRSFLGADPVNAYRLKDSCETSISFPDTLTSSYPTELFRIALGNCIQFEKPRDLSREVGKGFEVENFRFYPQMILEISKKIAALIENQKAQVKDIVVLAPYLSDALKFSFSQNLSGLGIAHTVNRPSRVYINDPLIRSFITFAKMAYQNWPFPISALEIRNGLMLCIPDLDIVRADLIIQTLFSSSEKSLRSFDSIQNRAMQERISFRVGEKLAVIQGWLDTNRQSDEEPLDIFFSRLFGELFSKRGFKLFGDLEAANKIHKLIQSIKTFRQFASEYLDIKMPDINLEYIQTIQNGLLPSSFFTQEEKSPEAVRIEPAHTFLMQNSTCDFQFWLDAGSLGWWERLNQPLTNPYLLRRDNPESTNWSDADEFHSNQQSMHRVIQGLARRCRKKIFIGTVHVNEYGNEHRGPLLQAINELQKELYHLEGTERV